MRILISYKNEWVLVEELTNGMVTYSDRKGEFAYVSSAWFSDLQGHIDVVVNAMMEAQ